VFCDTPCGLFSGIAFIKLLHGFPQMLGGDCHT
jgi:hypothetical protein